MADGSAAPSTEERSRYESLRKELISVLPKKRNVDKQLAQIEVQIYNLEANYLTETAAHSGGNIIQGFDGYLKNQATGRRKYEVNDNDRIFSHSSLTYQKSLDLMGEGDEPGANNEEYAKQSTPGPLTTVVLPPAKNQELSMAQQKRNRDKEYQRKKRASVSHRSTGDSDEEVVPASSSRRPTKRARVTVDDE